MCQEHLQHNIFIPPWLRNNVTLSCSEQKGLHHNIPQTWCILPFCHLVLILSERVTQLFGAFVILKYSSIFILKINILISQLFQSMPLKIRERPGFVESQIQILVLLRRPARCSLSSVQMTRCRRDFVIFIVPPHRGPPVKLTKKLKYARIYILHFHGPHKATPPPRVSITTTERNPTKPIHETWLVKRVGSIFRYLAI